MTSIVFTPLDRAGTAVELSSSLWRKRLLPIGQVEYKGRTLKFTRDYLASLAEAFRQRAYDQVPFQLAGDDNRHTNDVERYGGEVVDLDLADDGLYAIARTTERGSRVLEGNPGLGISARIVESYQRSDGKFFPAAIQHVLGTLDPRIPQLGPWEPIEASNGDVAIIDLSSANWDGQPAPGPSHDWSGLDATPREIHDLDQIMAELADFSDEDLAVLNGLDGAAEMAAQSGRQVELARELALELANQGDYAESAEVAGTFGIELANAGDVVELAYATEAARVAEDGAVSATDRAARERGHRPSDQERLDRALGRAAAGTLTPQGMFTRDFASPSSAASQLARHRWHPGEPGGVTGQGTCGASDDLGYCLERFHSAGCGSVATTEIAQGLASTGAYARLAGQAFADSNGRPWQDQYGLPASLTAHIESAAGCRLTGAAAFETGGGARDLAAIARQPRIGDYDDGDDPGISPPHATATMAAAVAAQMGVTPVSAARERERVTEDPRRVAAMLAAAARGTTESTRDRAERVRQPVELRQVGETWNGSLPAYTRG